MMTLEERRARQREYWARYKAANPDKVRESNRRYHAANADKINDKVRRWQAANPDRKREYGRKASARWAGANPDKVRAIELHNKHGLWPEDLTRMHEAQQGMCYLCAEPLPDDRSTWAIDHDHRCCRSGRSCRYCRRGLAHVTCNSLIGFASDDPERMRRIADNLEAVLAEVTRRLASKPVQDGLYELSEIGA